MWAEELAGSHRLLFTLLALPELQERLEHMETVVDGTQAEQGSRCGVGNQGGRLGARKGQTAAVKVHSSPINLI